MSHSARKIGPYHQYTVAYFSCKDGISAAQLVADRAIHNGTLTRLKPPHGKPVSWSYPAVRHGNLERLKSSGGDPATATPPS
ncbi:hypothetical protein GJAV_G00069840 [Gymnothorax javanicus]|nr:hypothetical protein GJAV_G00069840 [Gymnothorax javanicus]